MKLILKDHCPGGDGADVWSYATPPLFPAPVSEICVAAAGPGIGRATSAKIRVYKTIGFKSVNVLRIAPFLEIVKTGTHDATRTLHSAEF